MVAPIEAPDLVAATPAPTAPAAWNFYWGQDLAIRYYVIIFYYVT